MKKIFILISLCTASIMWSQENKTTVDQNPYFETLLREKTRLNEKEDLKERYKVQVFYGESSECKVFLNQFKKDFKEIESTIVYTNPSFKVWVGNFDNRLEGERLLKELKVKYPTALLIKPSK